MKKKETIKVLIYASSDYDSTEKTHYHASSIDNGDPAYNELTENGLLIGQNGIFGGKKKVKAPLGTFDSAIIWADKRCNSVKKLAEEIIGGADKHRLRMYHFVFDYTENFFVHYGDLTLNEEGYTHWHGRSLTAPERKQFVKSFFSLCKKESIKK